MSTNPIPTTLNDILVKLTVLSKLEQGQKLNLSNFSFEDAGSWWGAIRRTIYGENRKSLITHLNQIINKAINCIEEYKETEFCSMVVNHLAKSKIGIESLLTTYQDDPHTVSNIEVIIRNIDTQLNKNRHLLDGHNNNNNNNNNNNIDYSIKFE